MKKLAIAGAILALSTSALADNTLNIDEKSVFFKAGGLLGMGHTLKSTNLAKIGVTNDTNNYGEYGFGLTAGVGYHIMDNVRVSVDGFWYNAQKWNYKMNTPPASTDYLTALAATKTVVAAPNATPAVTGVTGTSGPVEVTNSGFAGFANVSVDVLNMGPATFFAGGGLGGAYTEDKVMFAPTAGTSKQPVSVAYEQKISFAWNLSGGFAFDIAQNITLDVAYLYANLGSEGENKSGTDFAGATVVSGNANLKYPFDNNTFHNVLVGLRFSM